MEFKGTKGEWTVDNEIYYNEYNAKTLSIDFQPDVAEQCAEVYMGISDSEEELRANAQLIASAPDLLKALQVVVIAIESMDFQDGTLFKASHHKAIKAINKALNK